MVDFFHDTIESHKLRPSMELGEYSDQQRICIPIVKDTSNPLTTHVIVIVYVIPVSNTNDDTFDRKLL